MVSSPCASPKRGPMAAPTSFLNGKGPSAFISSLEGVRTDTMTTMPEGSRPSDVHEVPSSEQSSSVPTPAAASSGNLNPLAAYFSDNLQYNSNLNNATPSKLAAMRPAESSQVSEQEQEQEQANDSRSAERSEGTGTEGEDESVVERENTSQSREENASESASFRGGPQGTNESASASVSAGVEQLTNRSGFGMWETSEQLDDADGDDEAGSEAEEEQFASEMNASRLSEVGYERESTSPGTDEDPPWSLDDFDIGRDLGKGRFGNVYLARERRSGYIVALKKINKALVVKNKVQQQVEREIQIQAHLRHENIVRLFAFFWDDRSVYLTLEVCPGGELYQLMLKQKNNRFEEDRAARYMQQIILAVRYLHRKNVIHRDLKPENILLSAGDIMKGDSVVKIADFGWSVHTVDDFDRRQTMCGTLDYLSPEMVEKYEHDKEVDIWGLGVLMYEMLVGNPPFYSKSSKKTYKGIKDVKIPWGQCEHLSDESKDLIGKFLQYNAADRIDLDDALAHPWIVGHCGSVPEDLRGLPECLSD